MTIEEKIREFTGPDLNGDGNARYRAYLPTVKVTGDNFGPATLELPSRLEILNEKNEWVKHPVVFKNNDYMIIFHTNGYQRHYFAHSWNSILDKFYEDAKSKGLTLAD